jgi:hypothetical protein
MFAPCSSFHHSHRPANIKPLSDDPSFPFVCVVGARRKECIFSIILAFSPRESGCPLMLFMWAYNGNYSVRASLRITLLSPSSGEGFQ